MDGVIKKSAIKSYQDAFGLINVKSIEVEDNYMFSFSTSKGWIIKACCTMATSSAVHDWDTFFDLSCLLASTVGPEVNPFSSGTVTIQAPETNNEH